jgi:RNA polymerase sigma factor (sigma-70 family)
MQELSVAVVSKLKHGDLKSAMLDRGWSQATLARFLDDTPSNISRLLNLRGRPGVRWLTPERTQKLLELTGKLPDDLWPEWVSNDVLDRVPKEIIHISSVSVGMLEAAGSQCLTLPPSQEAELHQSEARDAIDAALSTLTPREELVVRLRFKSCELTLDETAARLGVSRDRVRQIEAKAIRKLRNPSRSRTLRNHY